MRGQASSASNLEMDLRPPEWEIRLADWASILALLLAIYNAVLITRVKKEILLNVTLGSLLCSLQENSQAMNDCLVLADASIDTFDEVVEVCHANIRTIRRRLGRRRSRFCRPLLTSIRIFAKQREANAARDVYNKLQGVIQELINHAEERRITG
jgi:hypothetical protein